MEGKLEHFDLTEVIAALSKAGRRGCIKISYSEGEGEVYFKKDWLTKIAISPNPVPFGNRLVRKKVITREQLDDLLDEKTINELPEPLGVLMVRKGWVEGEKLKEYLKEHVKECFFLLSTKKDGEFEVLEKAAEPEEELIQIDELVAAMQEMTGKIKEIKKEISSIRTIVKKNSFAKASDLSDDEEKLFFSFLDGEKSLEDIQRQGGFTEYETFVLAYELLEKGFIEVVND